MNELQVFQNSEFGELRVLEIEGKPWFPATACAKKLGYVNPQKAIRDHCKGVNEMVTPTNGGTQTMRFVPEGDLYRLIIHSKLPGAERFEKWVFDEVLPSIRRTGNYGQTNVAAIITQTATAVCTEMVKQLAPLFQGIANPPTPSLPREQMILEDVPTKGTKLRKRPASIIDRLCPELRRDVEAMLCDGRHTYSEICAYLKQEGISISISSVFRYAKRTGTYC